MSDKDAAALADAIRGAHTRLHRCRICQNFTDAELCPVCASAKRDTSVICVVEKPRDVQAFERTREYNGLYHVLHGLLDPLAGVGAEQLTVKELLARLKDDTGEGRSSVDNRTPTVGGRSHRHVSWTKLIQAAWARPGPPRSSPVRSRPGGRNAVGIPADDDPTRRYPGVRLPGRGELW